LYSHRGNTEEIFPNREKEDEMNEKDDYEYFKFNLSPIARVGYDIEII
jgi:hypothetical protein